MFHKWIISASALAVAVAPATLYATEIEAGSTQRIEVVGDVDAHCAISSPGDVEFDDLEREGLSADLHFGLDCNTPFVMSIKADHGALTNEEYPLGQGPYSGSLPYTVDFRIPARSPAPLVLRRSFSGGELAGGGSISSLGAIATEGMEVRVTLGRAEGEAGLIAGDYGETITITLAAI